MVACFRALRGIQHVSSTQLQTARQILELAKQQVEFLDNPID